MLPRLDDGPGNCAYPPRPERADGFFGLPVWPLQLKVAFCAKKRSKMRVFVKNRANSWKFASIPDGFFAMFIFLLLRAQAASPALTKVYKCLTSIG
jgi:hypothetical protein